MNFWKEGKSKSTIMSAIEIAETIMNAEPVKKVRKVKRSNPLKGAIIDADLKDEEKEKIFNKVIIEELEEDTSEDAEIAEANRLAEEAVANAYRLKMRKEMKKRSGEIVDVITQRLEKERGEYELKVSALKAAMDKLGGFKENSDELMDFLADYYNEEAATILGVKGGKKTATTKGEKKEKGFRTAIDRTACLDLLPNNIVLLASGNHKTDKNRGKITIEVVFNADTKRFYNRTTKVEYEHLQDANRVWCNERGYEKLGNAWEDFKALNLKTNKTKSIQHIWKDGENWIEDEGASEFLQK